MAEQVAADLEERVVHSVDVVDEGEGDPEAAGLPSSKLSRTPSQGASISPSAGGGQSYKSVAGQSAKLFDQQHAKSRDGSAKPRSHAAW